MGDLNLFLAFGECPENPFGPVYALQKSVTGCCWWLSLSIKLTWIGNLKKENDRVAWVLWLGEGWGGIFHFYFKWLKADYGSSTGLMVVWFLSSHYTPTSSVFSWQRAWITVLIAGSECGKSRLWVWKVKVMGLLLLKAPVPWPERAS